MHLCTPRGGGSVGLKAHVSRYRSRYTVLPTKTSLRLIDDPVWWDVSLFFECLLPGVYHKCGEVVLSFDL